MTRTSGTKSGRWRLLVAGSLFGLVAAPLAAIGPVAATEIGGDAQPSDRPVASEHSFDYAAADYTRDSWASFASAKTDAERQHAANDLVMVRGLKSLVADYETRVPGDYTADSWAPFATALTTATDVAGDRSATKRDVAAAKTDLQTAASELEPRQGSFETITNDTFWNDTDGNPIYSQGGGVFKFGDTYYWYGVHYTGAEYYRDDPSQQYDGDVTFVSIPVYSSQDLVNWKFENDVATADDNLYGWVGRLGVAYNENTGKYVLLTQGPGGIVFLQGDSPTDDFEYATTQGQIEGNPTPGTGDQTVFTDDDGQDYLVYSNAEGRAHAFVSKISESDSLYVEPAVEVGYNSEGREGNAMFKLDGTYYLAASDLHGWNSSVNHVIESTAGEIQGDYSDEYTLAGTEMDYSHVTQTGFFVTVQGTQETTVLYAGDRWADFAWNGIGYNQWMPITKTDSGLEFHSMSQWQFNAATGQWRVGPENNYIRNPDFEADRVEVSEVTGWTNAGGSVYNVEGGANSSQYALQVDGGAAQQEIEVPAGGYTLSLSALGDGGEVVVTDADGNENTLEVPSSGDWTEHELTDIELPGGAVTVTVRTDGYLTVDALSLAQQAAS